VSETRASLDRLARHGIEPNRELGQNFLVDDNILDVIGRAAELDPNDVVVEIGGGLGILSSFLAQRVAHLHVIETDKKLEPALREALADHEQNSSVVIADVMRTRVSGLDPLPNKVVANLPYGVATPAILKTIDEMPETQLWCVMVQREIADRLAAVPSTKAYGIPSVLAQHACDVKIVRPISRTVFRPVPNVDSALVVMRRKAPAASDELAALVRAAFAHRRKALARSLEEAGGPAGIRAAVRAALEELGHPPDARAETLTPEDFVQLERELERPG
jgi:16S rRNA (adenine1518-N6/adenine1519-N6)-dimethyltransferase